MYNVVYNGNVCYFLIEKAMQTLIGFENKRYCIFQLISLYTCTVAPPLHVPMILIFAN